MDRRSSLGMNIRLVYLMIYLLPVAGSLFFLIFDFKDRETRLHALQTFYLSIAVLITHIILGLLAAIPFIGLFFNVLIVAMYIIFAFIMLIGLAKALNGSVIVVPFFYDIAYRGSY